MEEYQKEFASLLAETEALFFTKGLRLKDGRPTPYFINLGLFRTGKLASLLGSFLGRMIVAKGLTSQVDVLLGPSYKGSALAVATAQALWIEHGVDLAFDYDRKEAKTHGESTGVGSIFVTKALKPQARIFIIDDVGTTMRTKYDILKLLKAESSDKKLGLTVVGVGLAVDREQTTAVLDEKGMVREGVKGEDAIGRFMEKTGVPVHSILGIRQTVRYLAEAEIPVLIHGVKRPLDPVTVEEFEEYLETYGVPERN